MLSFLNHRRVRRAMDSVWKRPAKVVDVLVAAGLGLVLLLILFRLGGYAPFGSTLIAPAWVLIFTAGLHVVSRLLRNEPGGIHPAALLPVPLLVVALISQALVSGWSLGGDLKLALWIQAALIFWIVLHSARSRNMQFGILGVASAVLAVGFYAAFRQAYFEPHWFPFPDRLRDPGYGDNYGGYIAVPKVFAGWILLLVPFYLIGAGGRRLNGPVRILLGFMAFASFFALMVAGSLEGLVAFLVLLFLTPLFTVAGWKGRRRVYSIMVLVALVVGGLLWATASPMQSRTLRIVETRAEGVGEDAAAVALSMFQDRPIEGHGLGAIPQQWDAFAPEEPRVQPRYAHNDWMELLAELGILGLLAAVVPLLGLLFFSYRALLKLPFHQLTEEEAIRLARRAVEGRHRNKRQRRHRKEHAPKGNMPGQRILIPSLFLGLLAFAVFLWFSFSAQFALPLFTAAILAALLARSGSSSEWRAASGLAARGLAAIVPILLIAVIVFVALPAFQAQERTFAGEEAFAEAMADPRQLFFLPAPIEEAEAYFTEALQIHPRNLDALGGLAQTILYRVYLEEETEALGQRALPYTRQALEMQPTRGVFHLYHAIALGFVGAPWEEVEGHFEQAVYQAPHRTRARIAYAQFLLLNGGTRDEVMALVEEALAINPNYGPAREMRARLVL